MIWLKRALILVLVLVIGFFAWNWFFGPLKAKRQFAAYTEAMSDCRPLEQTVTAMTGGRTLSRSVRGPHGATCGIEMQTPAPFPEFLVCDLPLDQMPVLAADYLRQNDNIGLFGITRVQIDINSDDPMTAAMNSPACRIERR